MTEKQFKLLANKARELMNKSLDVYHDYSHIERVLKNSLEIKGLLSKNQQRKVNNKILQVSVLWHDISYAFFKKGFWQYLLEGRRSKRIARKYFEEVGLLEKEIDLICDVIINHTFGDLSFLNKGYLNTEKSLYHQITQDADSLDENMDRISDKEEKNVLIQALCKYVMPLFFKFKDRKMKEFLNLEESFEIYSKR